MRPRLVATDLDGTFLGADSAAHPANLEAARQLIDAGIEFVVATGRPRRWLGQLQPLLELNPVVISSNGAAIGRLASDGPDTVHPIPPSEVGRLADELPASLDAVFGVEFPRGWGHEAHYPAVDPGAVVASLSDLLSSGPVLKLMVHTREADTEELAAVVTRVAGDKMVCTFSWTAEHGTVELSAAGVTKGAALAEVISARGLDPAECAAFGDMPNDLDMLQLVGWPFVMAGAHPSLLGHGFTVIGDHADGAVGQQFARWLADLSTI